MCPQNINLSCHFPIPYIIDRSGVRYPELDVVFGCQALLLLFFCVYGFTICEPEGEGSLTTRGFAPEVEESVTTWAPLCARRAGVCNHLGSIGPEVEILDHLVLLCARRDRVLLLRL